MERGVAGPKAHLLHPQPHMDLLMNLLIVAE